MISAYPLQWPEGWPRLDSWKRKDAQFRNYKRDLSISVNVKVGDKTP